MDTLVVDPEGDVLADQGPSLPPHAATWAEDDVYPKNTAPTMSGSQSEGSAPIARKTSPVTQARPRRCEAPTHIRRWHDIATVPFDRPSPLIVQSKSEACAAERSQRSPASKPPGRKVHEPGDKAMHSEYPLRSLRGLALSWSRGTSRCPKPAYSERRLGR